MTQFKVGDKVVRFRDPWGSGNIGVVGVVTEVLISREIRVSYAEGSVATAYESHNFTLANTHKNSPHKHAEVIKAWADGAEIQFRFQDSKTWHDISSPQWTPEHEYRVKPAPKPDRNEYLVVHKGSGVWRKPTLREAQERALHDSVIIHLIYDGETDKIKTSTIVQ